jgi:hypothetical protein
MNVHFGESLKASRSLADAAKAANDVLADAIGPPALRVTADWDLRTDASDRPVIQLQLHDAFGVSPVADFSFEELNRPQSVRRRFYRLWGDLLEDAGKRKLQALESATIDQ